MVLNLYLSVLLISLSSLTCISQTQNDSKKLVPAVYIFGGSLVDVGNSNYTADPVFRADFPPYGIDFPTGKPTGRFSNGKLISDFLAEKVGLSTAEPSLSIMKSEDSNIAKTAINGGGVNFASAGAGVLNATYPFTISLTKQVEYYSKVHEAMVQEMGSATAQAHFSKSLYPIVIGSNDLFLYFQPDSDVSKQITPQQYVDSMLSTVQAQMKRLHDLGARKYVVLGVGMIGCIPFERARNKNQCKVELDFWVTKYNEGLKSVMTSVSSEFKDIHYSYFDTFSAYLDIVKNPATYGFKEVKAACCGRGQLNAEIRCIPNSTYCSNRDDYFFWNPTLPSQKVASLFVEMMFDRSQYVTPMNLNRLVSL